MSEASTTRDPRGARHRVGVLAALLALMVLPFSIALADDAPDQVLHVDLGGYYFQLSGQAQNAPITLQTGVSYAIEFHNVGSMVHEFQIGRNPGTKDGHPHDYQTFIFDGVETKIQTSDTVVEGLSLGEVELEPGATVTLYFTLPASTAGTWELGCFKSGHYEQGMHAPVIVK